MTCNIFHCALFAVLAAASALLAGCRQEDVRTMTVEIPGLASADRTNDVVKALARYQGVRKDSYRWNLEKRTLTLTYDSMQLAETNVRMAIQEKGMEVVFPTNATGRAGH